MMLSLASEIGARVRLGDRWRNTDKALLIRSAVLLASFGGVGLQFSLHAPTWDELYFLHRAACVDNAIRELSVAKLDICMLGMHKSPIMGFMLTPGSWVYSGTARLNVAPWTLAIYSFVLVWLVIWFTQRLRIPVAVIVLAALATWFNPHVSEGSGSYVVDGLLALTIVNSMLLLPLEFEATAADRNADLRRGALWGALGSIGVLSKFTFGYFIVLIFVPVLVISLLRVGVRRTAYRVAGVLLVSLIPLVILVRYGDIYLSWALSAAFGDVSKFYADGQSSLAFILASLKRLGWAGIFLVALAFYAFVRRDQRRERLIAAAYLTSVVVIIFVLASLSVNRDPRFFLPIWLALPWCIAVACQSGAPAAQRGDRTFPIALTVVASLVATIPLLRKLDLNHIDIASQIVHRVAGQTPVRLMLISDAAPFNNETFTVARELGGSRTANVSIDTLVYDVVNRRPLENSLARLLAADFAIDRSPIDKSAPDWANQSHDKFLAATRANADTFMTVGAAPAITVYRIRRGNTSQ